MIFVTVGTHEQGMNRLIIELDKLVEYGELKQEIFAQTGYSTYIPKNYNYKNIIKYEEMERYVKESNIIITHGGPGSIFQSLQYDKIPIVVPRNPEFKEHVDNHQILFTKRMEEERKIIAVYEIKLLKDNIVNYDKKIEELAYSHGSRTSEFVREFNKLCTDLLAR